MARPQNTTSNQQSELTEGARDHEAPVRHKRPHGVHHRLPGQDQPAQRTVHPAGQSLSRRRDVDWASNTPGPPSFCGVDKGARGNGECKPKLHGFAFENGVLVRSE
eukprot:TRINITY_DN2350_c0_g1_i3.p1 TRINITY_DN2350_c0_g1~~TRINITY_DN2350_c0_g1_i3.p1  ORF type:complete len:106 (-),score=14.18 TRINITY_DN2350_c0_g1_i3:351-668(-)